MTITERQCTMLAHQIEGVVERFLTSVGVTAPFDQGYAKEAVLLNLLANTLIFRTVVDRDLGLITKEQMSERVNQRVAHIAEKLPECVQFQSDLHAKKKQSGEG